ncbi:serine protease [Pseudomonas sp. 3A(2025)]
MKSILPASISCVLALSSLAASAQSADYGDGLQNLMPSRVLNNQDGRHDHWKGIGRIQSDGGRSCTATLIDTRSANSAVTAPAYVLTSGHCLYRKHNGVILDNEPVTGAVTFNYFADTLMQQQPYPLKRVIWSSMQGVDLAIVELDTSLNSLIQAGIQPLKAAEEIPATGTDILLVGAPLPFETPYLRLAACTLQSAGAVIEHPWVWRHNLKNQCLDVETGSSGSPVVTRDSNQVIAVLNTTTLSSTGKNPNLVQTPDARSGNFGNPVDYLRRCFVDGEFKADPRICPLFPVFSIELAVLARHGRYAKVIEDAQGKPVYPRWDVAFSIDKPFYRYKAVSQTLECENPDHYSHTIAASDARIDDLIGPRAGTHLLCILGVDSADERPTQGVLRNALTLAVELQAPSPPSPPEVNITRTTDSYTITWQHGGERVSRHTFKAGPPDTTDCNDPTGYKRVWRSLTPFARRLPLKVCTYAYDHADQRSAVREDLLKGTYP